MPFISIGCTRSLLCSDGEESFARRKRNGGNLPGSYLSTSFLVICMHIVKIKYVIIIA